MLRRRAPQRRFAFAGDDTVGDLIAHYPDLAPTLIAAGIDPLADGDERIADGCARLGLDVDALLERLALVARKPAWDESEDWSQSGLQELVDHVVASHHAYLAGELPRLVVLAQAAARRSPAGRELHHRMAEFANLLGAHLAREEAGLFPVCLELEHAAHSGSVPNAAALRVAMHDLESGHDGHEAEIAALAELVEQLPAEAVDDRLRAALRDGLAALERDLDEHHRKEEEYLFPAALHAHEVLSTGIFRHDHQGLPDAHRRLQRPGP